MKTANEQCENKGKRKEIKKRFNRDLRKTLSSKTNEINIYMTYDDKMKTLRHAILCEDTLYAVVNLFNRDENERCCTLCGKNLSKDVINLGFVRKIVSKQINEREKI